MAPQTLVGRVKRKSVSLIHMACSTTPSLPGAVIEHHAPADRCRARRCRAAWGQIPEELLGISCAAGRFNIISGHRPCEVLADSGCECRNPRRARLVVQQAVHALVHERSSQRRRHVLLLPVRRMISWVPTPSPVSSRIRARFAGASAFLMDSDPWHHRGKQPSNAPFFNRRARAGPNNA